MVQLFITFIQVGLFTIGGGLVAVPILQQYVVDKHWMSLTDFLTVIAVSESTPGSIGVNMATVVGNQQYGIVGGGIATAGLILPSLVIIIFITKMVPDFNERLIIKKAFYGIRPAVIGILFSTGITLFGHSVMSDNFNVIFLVLFILLFVLSIIDKFHPILIIVIGGLSGYLFL